MEQLVLMNGKKYPLAVNGFWANEAEVKISMTTEAEFTEIKADFEKANTATLSVVNDDGLEVRNVQGFTRMGSIINRVENAVISAKVIPEVRDENGEIVTSGSITEEKGTVVSFSMFKEKLDDQVLQNRADIDYLLMMEV